MRRTFSVLFAIMCLLTISAEKSTAFENNGKSRYTGDHLIVKLKKNNYIMAASYTSFQNDYTKINKVCQSLNLSVKKVKKLFPADLKNNTALYRKYELETYFVVFLNKHSDINTLCNDFNKNESVDFAEPDFIGEAAGLKGTSLIPNDEFFSRQWGLQNDGTIKTTNERPGKKGADMNVLNGWEIETGSENIIIAILDSGTKLDHPDLSGRIWLNIEETKNGRDDDGNGFIDDINGYNFSYDNPNIKDDGGHGTNIAGTIGASANNSLGYAGIDQRCRLMICKNLDDENLGEYSWWAASLYYAANNGARVINMSEGGYDYSRTLENAINYAYESGCLIIASMMNKNNEDSYYPASFKNVLAVGATDTDDRRCKEFTWGGGSNWGLHIAVIAPGNKVYGLDYKDNYNYDVYWSGTSQATAYVSGIASLLLSQDPGRTNKQLREIITSTAIDQVGDPREDIPGWDQYYGYGRVDLYEALTYGISPSGKKEVRKIDEIIEPTYDETKDSNSSRAKANDPNENYEYNSNNDDDKRAKKPKADDR